MSLIGIDYRSFVCSLILTKLNEIAPQNFNNIIHFLKLTATTKTHTAFANLHSAGISPFNTRLMVTPHTKCNHPPYYADGLVLFYL